MRRFILEKVPTESAPNEKVVYEKSLIEKVSIQLMLEEVPIEFILEKVAVRRFISEKVFNEKGVTNSPSHLRRSPVKGFCVKLPNMKGPPTRRAPVR